MHINEALERFVFDVPHRLTKGQKSYLYEKAHLFYFKKHQIVTNRIFIEHQNYLELMELGYTMLRPSDVSIISRGCSKFKLGLPS